MKFRTQRFPGNVRRLSALVSLALSASVSLIANAEAPKVTWKSPVSGAILSGTITGSTCAVDATSSVGMTGVSFWINNYQIQNVYHAPFNCTFDTKKLADGAYTMKAQAYSARNELTTVLIPVTIKNSAATTPPITPPANKAPTVSFTSPAASQTVSGTLAYSANATDDSGVTKVDFSVDSTVLGTKTAAPWTGSLDTTKLANGAHVLKAVASDAQGLTATSQVSINVQNVVANPVASTPAPTAGALGIWFKAPANGATVSGTLNPGLNCYIKGTGSIARVDFFVDSTKVGTDSNAADGMQCQVDTTRFANGSHQLKAVAFDAAGASSTDIILISIQNAATTQSGAGANQAPNVAFTAPGVGQTVSGTLAYAANATDDKAVTKVVFMADATTLATKTAAPWTGSLDTKSLTNGGHKLIALAYDAEGLSNSAEVAINVNNAPPNLPAGGKAVTTFESIGLYWTPPSKPDASGCIVQFKKSTDSAWGKGLNMWYDSRNNECRGSLVQVSPGTAYDIQMGTGSTYAVQLSAQTWSEQFPIAQTITLPAGTVTQPLVVTKGGSSSGYVLYQANAAGTTIDVQNAFDNNVEISAPFVILRGVTLKGGRINGIELKPGAHDLVIEGNDISAWGRYNTTSGTAWNGAPGWDLGVDMDSGIRARCTDSTLERVVIQRNKIHDPRYGANSWDWAHPSGPQGITFSYCGGNNVMRYNEITSADSRHYYNDGIGGEDNNTVTGFPNADTDIYGNLISGVMDDGIEAEGGDKNVRIWGNYLDITGTGIASTVDAVGPLYIFRNVYNRSRMKYITPPDQNDDRGPFFKSGSENSTIGDGRRYVFHNTSLQPSGGSLGLGAGGGLQSPGGNTLTNTVSRNNIYQIWKPSWPSVYQSPGSYGNDVDYDLYNGTIDAGVEANGIKGTPVYQSGSGIGMSGMYQLAPSTPGYGKAAPIPNFNDAYASPDMGAHQSGAPAMKFGANQ